MRGRKFWICCTIFVSFSFLVFIEAFFINAKKKRSPLQTKIHQKSTIPQPHAHQSSTSNLGKCAYIKASNQLNFYRSVKQTRDYFHFRDSFYSNVLSFRSGRRTHKKALIERQRRSRKLQTRRNVNLSSCTTPWNLIRNKSYIFLCVPAILLKLFLFAFPCLCITSGENCLSDDEWMRLGEKRKNHLSVVSE